MVQYLLLRNITSYFTIKRHIQHLLPIWKRQVINLTVISYSEPWRIALLPHYWTGEHVGSISDVIFFSFHGKQKHSLAMRNISSVLFTHLPFPEQLWQHAVLRSPVIFRNTWFNHCPQSNSRAGSSAHQRAKSAYQETYFCSGLCIPQLSATSTEDSLPNKGQTYHKHCHQTLLIQIYLTMTASAFTFCIPHAIHVTQHFSFERMSCMMWSHWQSCAGRAQTTCFACKKRVQKQWGVVQAKSHYFS